MTAAFFQRISQAMSLNPVAATFPGMNRIRKQPEVEDFGKDNFYTRYYEAIERADCRKLKPYACRHTAATAQALENVVPGVIQRVMRHAKFSTTEHYIHVNIDPMLEAVNRLQKQKNAPVDA